MAFALRRRQTVIVEIGRLRPISNFAGLNAVRLDGTTEPLNALAQRLQDAGCPVSRSAGDWLNPERFAGLSAIARGPSEAPTSGVGRDAAAVIARRLDGELRESLDLIGEAIRDHRFWLPPRRLPDFVWQQYDEKLAELDPDVHEPCGITPAPGAQAVPDPPEPAAAPPLHACRQGKRLLHHMFPVQHACTCSSV